MNEIGADAGSERRCGRTPIARMLRIAGAVGSLGLVLAAVQGSAASPADTATLTRLAQAAASLELTATAAAASDGDESGAIDGGSDGPFSLTAPPGWAIRTQSDAQHGRHTVIYPRGAAGGQALIYVNTAPRRGDETLDGLVARDVADSRQRDSALDVVVEPALRTADGKPAEIRLLRRGASGGERVAYVAAPNSFVLITLTARDAASLSSAERVFAAVVQSLQFTRTAGRSALP